MAKHLDPCVPGSTAERQLSQLLENLERLTPDRTRYQSGLIAGRHWGEKTASLDHLDDLEILFNQLQQAAAWPEWFHSGPTDGYSVAEWFHFTVIDPHGGNVRSRIERKPRRKVAEKFWRKVGATDEQKSTGEFLRGFAEGALQIWKAATGKA